MYSPPPRVVLRRKGMVLTQDHRWEQQALPLDVSISTSLLGRGCVFWVRGTGVLSMQHALPQHLGP